MPSAAEVSIELGGRGATADWVCIGQTFLGPATIFRGLPSRVAAHAEGDQGAPSKSPISNAFPRFYRACD
jgi:hypothetical protein